MSGSGARVTLALCVWLPAWAQALSARRPLISACCFRSSASCFALSSSLLSCGVGGVFLSVRAHFAGPFFLGGGRGSPLICCDSCHCEAPHRVSALVSSAAQTQLMVLKQTMMALSHRRPRLNNARAAGQCPAQLEPPSVPLASHTAPEPVSLPWSRGNPALKCCAGLAKRWHDQNHSVEQNRANEQAALTVTAAFSSAFTEAK